MPAGVVVEVGAGFHFEGVTVAVVDFPDQRFAAGLVEELGEVVVLVLQFVEVVPVFVAELLVGFGTDPGDLIGDVPEPFQSSFGGVFHYRSLSIPKDFWSRCSLSR